VVSCEKEEREEKRVGQSPTLQSTIHLEDSVAATRRFWLNASRKTPRLSPYTTGSITNTPANSVCVTLKPIFSIPKLQVSHPLRDFAAPEELKHLAGCIELLRDQTQTSCDNKMKSWSEA